MCSATVLFAQDSAAIAALHRLTTVAESSNFEATATGEQVEQFLKQLAHSKRQGELLSIGKTVEGRDIWSWIVEPDLPPNAKPLTVLLLGGIHSGECDGKEALLALARDLATGRVSKSPHYLRLIFVPNFNADGNERRGLQHRPGQDGPAKGMGVRTNAQDLDLNRDFIKLESPEVRALVAAMDRYDVDVLIDTHTTNGSLHRYDLTYAVANNPATPRPIDAWLRQQLLPSVTAELRGRGVETFFYGNFEDEHRVWKTFGHEPRYSTELMGLRGKIGILAESYSYASYRRRIEATLMFVQSVLHRLDDDAPKLQEMISQSQSNLRPGQSLPITAELSETEKNVQALGYQKSDGSLPAPPFTAQSKASFEPRDFRVALWATAQAKRETKLPYAYVVPANYAWAISRLKMQGVRLQRMMRDCTLENVEELIVDNIETKKGELIANHTLKRLTTHARSKSFNCVAGSYVINVEQPLGALAAYMLEPESDDSLAAWNFFDPDLAAGQPFPVLRVLEPIPDANLVTVHEIEPTEKITFDHVMRPGKTVNYANGSSSDPTWFESNGEVLLRRNERWTLMQPDSGASHSLEILSSLQAAFAKFDAFKSEESRQRLQPNMFSSDGKWALTSSGGDLYFYDVQANVARRLTESPKVVEQLPQLSPTGKHAAFVQDNDLYVIDCQTSQTRRLTTNGSKELLNGILDWVYQEELYGRGNFRAFWFSPSGEQLAFLQLDQSPVLHYQVSDSLSFRQDLEDTRYPKAGDPLPIARLWIADIQTGALQEVSLDDYPADDRLIVRVCWSPKNELWLQIQNRIQNEQSVLRVDPSDKRAVRVLHEKSPGWIEVLSTPKFLPNGDFLWLSDLPGGRRHLFRFIQNTQQLKPLTQGEWDIAELLSVSPDGNHAFVTGNYEQPTESHLLRVELNSGQLDKLTRSAGTHRPRVSPDGRYYIDTSSNINSPPVTELCSVDGRLRRVLEAPVSDRYQTLDRAAVRTLTITARDGLPLQSLVMLPKDIESGKVTGKRLPVLFHVYGGPQAPTVHNAWGGSNYWWHQYLCSQGYAIVLCDNRSARGRGISDTWKIYRDMGSVELRDLEDAVAWVSQQPWADKDRIGVWGWSYGGYFTAYALTHSKIFRAGIAGAPVTDWHNYDAIYTERYMDLPQNNRDGYKSSSTVTAAENLHGRLLLVHGERDDNVHMSNTLQLAHALQKAGKPFDMMIYPKNRHGVVDPAQRYHLYQTMTEFLDRHLKN